MPHRLLIAFALATIVSCDSSRSESAEPRRPTFAESVGFNTHYRSTVDRKALELLAGIGVTQVRNDLAWNQIEKERGVYDFEGAGYDTFVEACEKLGLRILFVLDYGNSLYGENRAVVDGEGRRAFAAFAAAVAKRYGGRGHDWEIWNEPNVAKFWGSKEGGPDTVAYSELVKAVAPALRKADPEARIAAGALFFTFADSIETGGYGIAGPRFLKEVAATDALSLVDEVTLHLYRPDQPEGALEDIELAQQILKDAGHDVPVTSGEWGYSTYDPNVPPEGLAFLPPVSPERQASYYARMLLLNFANGLTRSIIYKNVDKRDPSPGHIEHHWGITTAKLDKKPSYDALKTALKMVGDAPVPERLDLASKEYQLRFKKPDGAHVIALWAEQKATWTLKAEAPTGDERVVGRDGDDITPEGLADGVEFTLESDQGPIYLVGKISVTRTK